VPEDRRRSISDAWCPPVPTVNDRDVPFRPGRDASNAVMPSLAAIGLLKPGGIGFLLRAQLGYADAVAQVVMLLLGDAR
jgi:hypothetical protein